MNRPSLFNIFSSFLSAGLVSFGGAMPHVQRLVVEKKAWMDSKEFAETVGLCQAVPGPNATNVAICTGNKLSGLPGAIAAACGLLFFPICFAILVATFFDSFLSVSMVGNALKGMGAAGTGLLLGVALKLLQGIKTDRTLAYAVVGVVLLLVGFLKVHMLAALLLVLAFYLVRMRRALA